MSAKDEDKKDEMPADEAEERDESGAEKEERESSGGNDDSGEDDSGEDDSGDDDSGEDDSSGGDSGDDGSGDDDDSGDDEDAGAEAKPEAKKAPASEPPPSAPKAKARSVPPPAKQAPKHEHAAGHAEHHGDMFYVQIWAILVVLLVVSVVGPMLGHPLLTLITAFGIALVKAYMVAKNFMHLAIERRYVVYMLVTMVAFMVLLFAGVSPDVMKHKGHNWKNEAAEQEVKRALEAAKHDPHKAH